MAVHRTLRVEFNLWLAVGWGVAQWALLLYSHGMVARLAGVGMLLGAAAGFLLHLALVEGKAALLAATSAPEVRAALAATRSGGRARTLFRATLGLAVVLTALELALGAAMPKGASPLWWIVRVGLDYAAVVTSFMVARELVMVPALWRLERAAK